MMLETSKVIKGWTLDMLFLSPIEQTRLDKLIRKEINPLR